MYLRAADRHGPLLHGAEIPDRHGFQHGDGGHGRDGEVVHHRVHHVALHEPSSRGRVAPSHDGTAGTAAARRAPGLRARVRDAEEGAEQARRRPRHGGPEEHILVDAGQGVRGVLHVVDAAVEAA